MGKRTLIDRAVAYFNPVAGMRRATARNTMAMLDGMAPGNGVGLGTLANEGASAKRGYRAWGVSGGDADSDLLPEQEILRARTRDLYRNNPLARGAIKTLRTNVVGSGLRLNAAIDRDVLGLSDEQAEEWERQAEREFHMWADSQFSDATLTGNFYELQALAFLSVLQSGDAFALLPWIKRKGSPYDLRIQLIEADRVCNQHGWMDTQTCAGGIEVDGYGAPAAYWICTPHPGARFLGKPLAWKRIPAFGYATGRRNVLHLFDRERPEQRRGYPFLAPVIGALKQLGRYTEAELQAAVVSGMFTVFVKTETGEGLADVGLTPFDVQGVGEVPAGEVRDGEYALGNGAIVGLAPGEDITSADPKRPNVNFDPFVMAVLRQVGAALEIPFELLVKHFSASYSASRAALLEAWKFFRHRRDWLVYSFCAPVYAEWMTEAVIKGRVNAPGFLTDPTIRAAYLGAEWVGPTMGQLDPDKEVTAAVKRIDACLSTKTRESAELTGGDFEKIVRRRGREETQIKKFGLQPAPLPGAKPAGGNDAGSAGTDSGDADGGDSNGGDGGKSGGGDGGEE